MGPIADHGTVCHPTWPGQVHTRFANGHGAPAIPTWAASTARPGDHAMANMHQVVHFWWPGTVEVIAHRGAIRWWEPAAHFHPSIQHTRPVWASSPSRRRWVRKPSTSAPITRSTG